MQRHIVSKPLESERIEVPLSIQTYLWGQTRYCLIVSSAGLRANYLEVWLKILYLAAVLNIICFVHYNILPNIDILTDVHEK